MLLLTHCNYLLSAITKSKVCLVLKVCSKDLVLYRSFHAAKRENNSDLAGGCQSTGRNTAKLNGISLEAFCLQVFSTVLLCLEGQIKC